MGDGIKGVAGVRSKWGSDKLYWSPLSGQGHSSCNQQENNRKINVRVCQIDTKLGKNLQVHVRKLLISNTRMLRLYGVS